MSEIDFQERAPKGGIISPLNGEFYEGGQFVATTPLPRGASRKVARVLADPRPLAEVRVERGYRNHCCSIRRAGDAHNECVLTGDADECELFARHLINEQSRQLAERGLAQHPTILEVV